MISRTELIYKKILGLWLLFSLVIGPVIFLIGSYLHLQYLNKPIRTGCSVWVIASFTGLMVLSAIYEDEKPERGYEEGPYYKCILGALFLIFATALAVPLIRI